MLSIRHATKWQVGEELSSGDVREGGEQMAGEEG